MQKPFIKEKISKKTIRFCYPCPLVPRVRGAPRAKRTGLSEAKMNEAE